MRPADIHSLLSTWFDARPGESGPGHHHPKHYCLADSPTSHGDILLLKVGLVGTELEALLRARVTPGAGTRFSSIRGLVADDSFDVISVGRINSTNVDEVWAAGAGVRGWRVEHLTPATNRRWDEDSYECLNGFTKLVGTASRLLTDHAPALGLESPDRLADKVILVDQELSCETRQVMWDKSPTPRTVPGAVGWSEWCMRRGVDPRPVHLALTLGEYVGVGKRPAYGFGAVRVTPLRDRR